MPHYFFDVTDNGTLNRDEFGLDLVDFEEARDQAIVLLPDMARDGLPDGELHVFMCTVREGEDRVVYRCTLTFQGGRPPGA